VEFSIKSGSPEKQRSACVVVGVFEPRKLTLAAELLDNAARNHLSDIIRRGDMEGKSGSTLLLHNVPGTLSALTHDPAQSGSFAGSPAFAAGAVKSRGAGGRRARDTRVEWGPWRGCREVSGTPVRSLDEPFPARTMPYGGMLGPSWADHSSCSRKGSARSPRIRAESSQGAAQEVRMKRIAPRTPN
jgi:hypothetical protein